MAEREKKQFIGLSQYRGAFNCELAGKSFHLVMDDGKELSMVFLDGENVQIAEKGRPYIWESYEGLKGDETTYLVHVRKADDPMINMTWVLDTEQRLVTMVLMEEGYDKEFPRLIRTTPFFGAIRVPGRELPTIRHHLSSRMVGHHIYWHYNPGFSIQHIYHSPNCIRASAGSMALRDEMMRQYEKQIETGTPEERAQAEAALKRLRERARDYPFYEEECFHIWINDHLNLFCFLEENMTLRIGNHDQGGGGILLLQDTERLIDVGLSFCAGEYYLCTAYGDENEDGDPLDTAESPYDWSKLHAMPSIHWEIPEEE
jgi:hypothetical protein